MGKINEYGSITTPAAADLLFIGDTSNGYQINNITVANLHKVAQVQAVGPAGLGLLDDGGGYGIFIKDGGDVGIGTATPDYKLDISATNPVLGITAGASGDAVIRFDQTTTQQATIGYDDTGDLLKFNNNSNFGGTNHLIINTDGNVGINTATPAALLEVKGNAGYIRSNTASTASYSGISFGENGTTKAYISYVGSTFATGASAIGRRSTLELRTVAGIAFFADNAGNADVFFRSNGQVGIGANRWSATALPEAALHLQGAGLVSASDAPLLEVEALSNNAVIYLKNSGGASAGYIINSYNSIFVGSAPVATQDTHLQISKTTGRLIIGGPISDYTYPLTVGSITSSGASATTAKPTVTRFYGCNSTASGVNTGKTYLIITNNTTSPQLGIVYDSNGVETWLSGTLYATGPSSYFGWNYIGGGLGGPDDATFDTTLENNTVYIQGTTGGISSANTAAAFGSVNGNGAGNPVLLTGAYNAAVTVAGAVATITFTKDLSNATYTVIATGWDVTNTVVMFGEVTAQAVGSCAITFRTLTTTANLETSGVKWTFAIYGAKLKAA